MNLVRSFFLLLAIVSLAALPARAQQPAPALRLPAILSDHMVVQRDTPMRVWGWARPGETVNITLGQATASAEADDKGEWSATLAKLAASDAPLEMIVKSGADTLTVRDILVGDVWVCSGQSNMAFNLGNCASAPAELAKARRPTMRLFKCRESPPARPSPIPRPSGSCALRKPPKAFPPSATTSAARYKSRKKSPLA